ncbi:hypothetical protein Tco_1561393 [Tanacetum coccineum]
MASFDDTKNWDEKHTNSPMITNSKLENGDEFLKILQDNAFNGMNGGDVTNHIARVLEITEWIKMPNVEKNELRLHVFSKSLIGDAETWEYSLIPIPTRHDIDNPDDLCRTEEFTVHVLHLPRNPQMKKITDGETQAGTPPSMCQTISNIDAHVEGEQFHESKQSRSRDLPRDNPLVSVEVLRGKLIQKLLLNQKCMGYLVRAYYSISPTSFQDTQLIQKLRDDKKCMKKVEPSSKSKTIEDIISIGSFVEAIVLNHYVLVRKIL